MTDNQRPREWWIIEHKKYDPYESHGFVFDDKKDISDFAKESAIHVIEKSAYVELEKQLAEVKEQWTESVQRTENIKQDWLEARAEIERLKEELKIICELKGAGISHEMFEMVCEERDTSGVIISIYEKALKDAIDTIHGEFCGSQCHPLCLRPKEALAEGEKLKCST